MRDRAVDPDADFLYTADVYGDGESEKLIGHFPQKRSTTAASVHGCINTCRPFRRRKLRVLKAL